MSTSLRGKPEPRLSTGVRGLDSILDGGFLPGNTFLFLGRPGTGKTILANQICSHQAQLGNGAVYVTLLAESHGRLIGNLRRLSFFDERVVSKTLHYISGYHVLEEQGPEGLRQLLHQLVKDKGARILVIDGLNVLESQSTDPLAFRKFFHELQFLTDLTRCTLLLTSNFNGTASATYPLVDGIMRFESEITYRREKRILRLIKYRGSDHLHGNHAYDISKDGIVVYPRREALQFPDANLASDGTRLAFDIAGLDSLMGGGVESKSATFVVGPSGTSKTALGLQFLCAGAKNGEPALYYGFSEAPSRVLQRTDWLGQLLPGYCQKNLLSVHWRQPLEVMLDAFAEELLLLVRQGATKRVFVDAIAGLAVSAPANERLTSFLPVVINELRHLGVTSLFSIRTTNLFSPSPDGQFDNLLQFADNIIVLQHLTQGSEIHHAAAIMKLRNHQLTSEWRNYSVTEQGFWFAPASDVPGNSARGRP